MGAVVVPGRLSPSEGEVGEGELRISTGEDDAVKNVEWRDTIRF